MLNTEQALVTVDAGIKKKTRWHILCPKEEQRLCNAAWFQAKEYKISMEVPV